MRYGILIGIAAYIVTVVTTERGWRSLTTLLGGTTRTERTQRGKVEGLLDELEQVSSRLQLEGDLAKKQGVDLALFHVRSRLT
ncbi:hypothetical protein BN1232_03832 [Mycobacterium lentiflavum]|uniref:Uncharacterized protein n=1 Tax=Mycobacterium lentiflavum TaxID=141349 RepID=A0A0E4CP89_MYCLN|nr:hypothetical protein [Mycobacterium lentiflavum]ULP40937.1 hypothetical protein MJO58_18710 [Mycobacterium lentiflavum]CQD17296.1 hypothetical protein BN1232_03832 [Mycobacterium lentiflavum]